MQNYIVTLYLVKLQYLEETFCKIGITKHTVNKRLRSNTAPYVYTEVLFERDMTLDAALAMEQYVVARHKKYKPMNKFSGWTEGFNSEVQNDILIELTRI